jgi:bifunctional non-homologous end joining protein LigD
MLATLVKRAPAGDGWVHEVKYDGYRLLARIERKRAQLFSRNGKDWTPKLGDIAAALAKLPVRSAWLDGELVALDAHGRSSFQTLQNALSAHGQRPLRLMLFDTLFLDGRDLRDEPLSERKRLLRKVIGRGRASLGVGPESIGEGTEFLKQSCALGLEGAVSKRLDSPYRSGERTQEWVKAKCTHSQEMVIGGYTEPQGSREGFGALLLGVYEGVKLRYSGKVGTGFDATSLLSLAKKLKRRERRASPFVDAPVRKGSNGVHWVRPDLVAQVEFTEWSDDGMLRHPSFQGLRADKQATEVVRERERDAPRARRR